MEKEEAIGLSFYGEGLIMVAAPPSTGKTIYSIQACFAAADQGYEPVVYFSLNSSSWKIQKLFLRHQIGRSGWITNDLSLQKMPDLPVYIEDYENLTIEKLIERIFYYKKEKNAKFFVIDRFHLIDCSIFCRSYNRETCYNYVLAMLHNIAVALSVTILIESSLSSHWTETGYPTVRDILDASEVEEYCDQIIFITNNCHSDYVTKNIHIAKGPGESADGETMTSIETLLDLETMSFSRFF